MTIKTQRQPRNPDRAERLLVYLSTKQRAALRQLSKRAGSSQQALIRAGINMVIAKGGK